MPMINRISILRADITRLKADAIVNAANSSLLGGGGVDGAIHRAAGPGLLAECKSLHGCRVGEAKITKGYNLPATYIIHTVGPVYSCGTVEEQQKLAACYSNSLKIAFQNNCRSVAFPNISTGVYGYPKKDAAEIAIREVQNFIEADSFFRNILFCCFDEENFLLYSRMLK
jgi:O-acetyl-ADP-ribose deacetylase